MSYVKGKSKHEILEDLIGTAQPNSAVHEQQKAAITVRCTEDIESSIKSLESQLAKNATSSDKVGNRLFWLNVVLTIATLVGALATVVIAVKTIQAI
ncbi:hypothetical protein JJQ94_03570 [Pseudoalteromonas sp. GCY]|uniref:hypothetical protein n=1 Tax=Pseudoalteromonas sp. GCY TaxID=2003316 RepID=UPI0019177317|nr:hypothetical protein [Pseudoalteromonas sp. GCY]QQQ64702.1 hypothetical protein JJQ94_03570 [Pseudoalteromonas sp. GCY]